jgi:hypothetical protein
MDLLSFVLLKKAKLFQPPGAVKQDLSNKTYVEVGRGHL